ncbi:MAG: YbaK/EbsC family protein [Nitrososphaeria archaeon]|nr:YbaK/EbsC family protein [Nitrososphaeria archaeon]
MVKYEYSMDLEKFLKENGLWYRFIEKTETIHTADAAKVAGIELNRLTKNLVSKTDKGEYVLLIVPGNKKVDLDKAAKVLGAKKVRLVPFDQAENVSGYPPGGTPSIGHKIPMKIIMDKSLLLYKTVFCGGGSRTKLLELNTEDIVRVGQAIVADISA